MQNNSGGQYLYSYTKIDHISLWFFNISQSWEMSWNWGSCLPLMGTTTTILNHRRHYNHLAVSLSTYFNLIESILPFEGTNINLHFAIKMLLDFVISKPILVDTIGVGQWLLFSDSQILKGSTLKLALPKSSTLYCNYRLGYLGVAGEKTWLEHFIIRFKQKASPQTNSDSSIDRKPVPFLSQKSAIWKVPSWIRRDDLGQT